MDDLGCSSEALHLGAVGMLCGMLLLGCTDSATPAHVPVNRASSAPRQVTQLSSTASARDMAPEVDYLSGEVLVF